MKTTEQKIADLLRLEERRQDMVRLKAQGKSLRDLSLKYGISRARVAQILKTAQ